jgi:hypothetical protein
LELDTTLDLLHFDFIINIWLKIFMNTDKITK